MNFASLLGANLKSDVILDILEKYDIDVVYDFDRLHENTEDQYWISAKAEGFLMRFNQNQILDTIFLYAQKSEGYNEIDRSNLELVMPEGMSDAKKYFDKMQIEYELCDGVQTIFGRKWWIKGDAGKLFIHYEFDEIQLTKATLIKKF